MISSRLFAKSVGKTFKVQITDNTFFYPDMHVNSGRKTEYVTARALNIQKTSVHVSQTNH